MTNTKSIIEILSDNFIKLSELQIERYLKVFWKIRIVIKNTLTNGVFWKWLGIFVGAAFVLGGNSSNPLSVQKSTKTGRISAP